MMLVIGTDEAGYGPNLGPLVVAATAWHVAAGTADAEQVLAEAVAEARADHDGPLWADSKQIYRGGDGFAALERGALVATALAGGGLPRAWPDLVAALGCDGGADPAPPEAARLARMALPVEAAADTCAVLMKQLSTRLTAARLLAIRCRILQPAVFNGLLDAGLNKSDILSQTTLQLAADLVLDHAAGDPTLVWCDRHGGRRRYAPLVARHFGAPLVQVVDETARRSVYDVPAAACRVEFTVGGEARLPVAVASMTAKYVREVAMRAFNAHWCGIDPGLAPTAGYPVDAARWRRQAAAAVTAAGIPWGAIWRRA